jgi:REP element-mobilizing transposase RayT
MALRYPRRPPRLERLFETVAPFHFVMFNTWKRASLLARHEVHETFRVFCERANREFRVAVGRYVLMPDHVHLFVFLPSDGLPLSRWVQSLRSVLGKQLLALGTPKPHWQEGFFDHVLRSDESYAQKWDYVRQNPVRAGLRTCSEDWPFQGEIVSIMM